MVLPVSEGFILALFGGFVGFVGGILTCALKSRCSRIKCCCLECDREVLPPKDLNSVNVEMPPIT